jgi:hypothetical protein
VIINGERWGRIPGMSAYFPFHALGLRCNPFRALTDEEWGDLARLPEALLALAPATHVQILGEHGHGKTSLLMGLAAQGRRAGQKLRYEYLAEGQSRFETPLAGLDVFLLDEAQRLSRRERGRLLAEISAPGPARRMVISSHTDLAPLFAQHRLPLATLHPAAASVEHLRAIVADRLAYFALPGGPSLALAPDALDYLHQRFGGNLRAVEQLLYEACQQHVAPGPRLPGLITANQLAALTRPPAAGPGSPAPG